MRRICIGLALAASIAACIDSSDQTTASGDHSFTKDGHKITVREGVSTDPPLASVLDPGPANVAGCWVTLQWCSEPGTGDAVCTFTNCTLQRALDACTSLISDNC